MRSVGKLILGKAGRRAVGLTALLVALSAATYADAAERSFPRLKGASSDAALAFAQAREWIVSHQGRYGNDPSSPGPSVVVDVPNSGGGRGFVEVWAQVRSNDGQTAVGLFDVTHGNRRFVPGQETLCAGTAPIPLPGDLFMTFDGIPGVYGTPMGTGPFCAGTNGAPGPVLLEVQSGRRRFKLEYADCGCGPGRAAVSHRRLWVRPAPTF